MLRSPVYKPREDTELLAIAVKEYAHGEVLDMGTGSGFLALQAAKKDSVRKVLGVDLNPDAIMYAKKHYLHEKIRFQISDMFKGIDGKFDTIIFNPPYLPDDPNIHDVALDGGKRGYEVSVRFIKNAGKHLKEDGQILFLFSSLTKKEVIDKTLIENCYIYEEIKKQKLDFEELYVYRIRKAESLIKDVKELKFFSKGKRGLIYTGTCNGTKVGVKIRNPDSTAIGRIFIEGSNLKEVNQLGIGPRLIRNSDDFIMYEFVEGKLFPEYLLSASKKEILIVVGQVLEQMRQLDEKKINKEEMTNPYKHILVTKDKKAVLIDFERANKTLKPHNVTQFCQYLVSANMKRVLEGKRININKENLLSAAKEYKKGYSQKYFLKIKKIISLE